MDEHLIAVIIPLLIALLIFYVIAEFFGRAKHIGRGWTFALLATSLIFGVIALISSPSAKNAPTPKSKSHQVFGAISIILGIISLFGTIAQGLENPISLMPSLGLFVLGMYLIEISRGHIVNESPRFYFQSSANFKRTESRENRDTNTNSRNTNFRYFIMKNNVRSKALTFEELRVKEISVDDFVWRKGLEDWVRAGDLPELEDIIMYTPPPFEPNKKPSNFDTEEKRNSEEEIESTIYVISGRDYRLRDIEFEFEKGNYILDRDGFVKLFNGAIVKVSEIPSFEYIRSFFPPKI